MNFINDFFNLHRLTGCIQCFFLTSLIKKKKINASQNAAFDSCFQLMATI